MSVQSLDPAMSRLTLKGSPVVWDRSALGTPAESSYLGLNFAGTPSTAEVRIRWKHIFLDAAQSLGSSEPVFDQQVNTCGKFQARVSFRLPLDKNRTIFTDIDVVGTECSTMYEAQSEASASALQVLQLGHLRIRVQDVSRMRCKELEKRCQDVLVHAYEVYHGVKALICSWADDMDKVERRYSPDRLKAAGRTTYGEERNKNISSSSVAEQLAYLMRENYLKLKEMDLNTEQVKISIDRVREGVTDYFFEAAFHQANKHRGDLPQEIALRMQLILQEMMISIGWQDPKFSIADLGMSVYTCETTLAPNHLHSGPVTKAVTVTGYEASSKEEAIESSCISAISTLENEKSICLVDLNYNHRSHGELYVVEAKEALQYAYLMGSKVIGQWEAMVDGIHTCKRYCQEAAAGNAQAEEGSMAHTKAITGKDVSELYKECLGDLQTARHHFNKTDG